MGEMADDHIDRILWGGGRPLTRARNRRNVICDRCAMRNLTWRETKEGWRLYEDADTMHQCGGPQPLSDDDFDVIEDQ